MGDLGILFLLRYLRKGEKKMVEQATATKRFLTVGSLLRPDTLLTYKEKISTREDISYPFYNDFEGYKEAEDEAVASVADEQVKRHFPEVTDGEFSKSMWHLDFVWGLHGVKRYIADHGYFFRDHDGCNHYETRQDIGIRITDKLNGKNHAFLHHFKRLKELAPEGSTLKQCIPSPSHIFGELRMSDNIGGEVYQTSDALKADLSSAYKDFLKEYAEIGGTIIQLDDCLWELFAEDNPNSPFTGEGIDQEEMLGLANEFIDLNNDVIAYAHELGLKVYTHNCRGNYSSRNMGAGSYENIAPLFLEKQNYDRFYLEWDDERAGSLEALQAFKNKPETEVVLGFLSSKTATLEDKEEILSRLKKATEYISKDKLYLSHQCGFASTDEGNELTEEQQWKKIEQGQEIAQEFWGE